MEIGEIRLLVESLSASRAFAEFAEAGLGDVVHEALVKEYVGDKVVMHVSRDATEVDAREKPAKKGEALLRPSESAVGPRKAKSLLPRSLHA